MPSPINNDDEFDDDEFDDEFDEILNIINKNLLNPMYNILRLIELQTSVNSEFYKLIATTFYKIELYSGLMDTKILESGNIGVANEIEIIDKIIKILNNALSEYHTCATRCNITVENFEEYTILYDILRFSVDKFEEIKNNIQTTM